MTDEFCFTYGEALALYKSNRYNKPALPRPPKIIITGAPKSGKTTCLHSMGVHACIGKDFESIEFERTMKFMLAQNDTPAYYLLERIEEHSSGLTEHQRELVSSNFLFTDRNNIDLAHESGFERIRKRLLAHKPDVWAIDPLWSLTVGVEPKVFLNRVDAVQEQLGCAVAMVHMDGDSDTYLDWAEVIIHLTKDKDGTVTTQCTDYRSCWG